MITDFVLLRFWARTSEDFSAIEVILLLSTRSHNVDSELNGQQWTWSSPFDSYKRRTENSRCPCKPLSLISQRRLTWSAGTKRTVQFARWQLLGAIWNPQRRQTRLRPCSNALWDFLLPDHMAGSSTSSISPISELIQRYARFSSRT